MIAQRVVALIPVLIAGKLVLALRKVHGGNPCHNIGCRKCSDVWQERAAGLSEYKKPVHVSEISKSRLMFLGRL